MLKLLEFPVLTMFKYLILLLSTCCWCGSGSEPIESILRSLHEGWNLMNLTLVYQTRPVFPHWASSISPNTSENYSWTGVNVSYLDGYKDLVRYVQENKPVTTMLALPTAKLKTVLAQVLRPETGDMAKYVNAWELLIPISDRGVIEWLLKGTFVPSVCQVFFVVLPPSWGRGVPIEVFAAFHHGVFRYGGAALSLTVDRVPRGEHIPAFRKKLLKRRHNLEGFTFRVGYLNKSFAPLSLVKHNPDFELSGYVGDVWRELGSLLNFCSTYIPSEDGKWGGVSANGDWNGLVGMLHRSEIDVAVADMSLTRKRTSVVDFTQVIYTLRFYVYFKKDPGVITWASILLIPPWEIFLVLVTTVFVSTLALLVALRLSPEPNERMMAKPHVVAWNNFFAFCMQGTEWSFPITTTTARSILWLTYFCGYVVFNMYSATMISWLAVSSNVLPFKTFDELVKSNVYSLTALSGSAHFEVLKTVLQQSGETSISDDLNETDMPHDVDEAIERVCNGNDAFMTSDRISEARTYRLEKGCNPAMLTTPFFDQLRFAVSKDLQMLDLLNQKLEVMMELGTLHKSKDKWFRPRGPPSNKVEPIGLHHIAPLFLLVLLGFTVSAILILVERRVVRRINRGHGSTRLVLRGRASMRPRNYISMKDCRPTLAMRWPW